MKLSYLIVPFAPLIGAILAGLKLYGLLISVSALRVLGGDTALHRPAVDRQLLLRQVLTNAQRSNVRSDRAKKSFGGR